MSRHRYSIFLLLILSVLALSAGSWAQGAGPADAETPTSESSDPEGSDSTEDAGAATTVDLETSLEALELRLLPLTQDELQTEAQGWIGRLQQTMRRLSNVEIELRNTTEAEARQALNTEAQELREEKAAIIERANLVLVALENKGGDPETHEQYIDAVSGTTVDVTDVNAVWTAISGWLTSPDGGLRWLKNIIFFIVALIATAIVAAIVRRLVRVALRKTPGQSALMRDFLVNLASKTVWVIGIIVALSTLGVNIGPMIAALGAAGLVLGFALQGTLSNFASGIMILMYRPFDVGDVVNVADVSGVVKNMTMVSTTIRTFDNQVITVPNNSIWGDVITNKTGTDIRRVDLVFGIGYDDDIDKATNILMELASNHEKTLDDPAPMVKLNELGDSSVNFIVRPWVKTEDYWGVYWDLMREVKKRFDAEGITIPYPQRDVHLHQVGAA